MKRAFARVGARSSVGYLDGSYHSLRGLLAQISGAHSLTPLGELKSLGEKSSNAPQTRFDGLATDGELQGAVEILGNLLRMASGTYCYQQFPIARIRRHLIFFDSCAQ